MLRPLAVGSMVNEVAAKKNKRQARATTADAHTVVLEDLRSAFLVFGEALQGLREHMDARFATVDHELGMVKSVVLDHGRQLGSLREEVTAVRDDVGVLRRDVELLKVAVIDNVRQIKQLRKAP